MVHSSAVKVVSACGHVPSLWPHAGHDGLRYLAALPALKQLDLSGTCNSLPTACHMPQLTALDMSEPVNLIEVLSFQ